MLILLCACAVFILLLWFIIIENPVPYTQPPESTTFNSSDIITKASASILIQVNSLQPIQDLIINLPTNIDPTLQTIIQVNTNGNPITAFAWGILCNALEDTVVKLVKGYGNWSYIVGEQRLATHLIFNQFAITSSDPNPSISVTYKVQRKSYI